MLLPSQLHNDGNYIISLGKFCSWLGAQAEALGVDVNNLLIAQPDNGEQALEIADTLIKSGSIVEFNHGLT